MISRRILAAMFLLWASPCLAQTGSIKTPTQLNNEINTTFPDNTLGQITPAVLRQVALDQVASVPFLNTANTFSAFQTFSAGASIGVATATSINGNIWTTGTGTLTLGAGKTFIVNNTITFSGTDNTSFSLPGTSDTLAALGVVQTWTGAQSFSDGKLILLGSSSGSSTIKAPANGGGTATLFSGSDTVVGLAAVQTLTNKTLSGAANTFTNIPAGTALTGQLSLANGGTGASSAQQARSTGFLNVDQITKHGDSFYSILATDRVVATSAAFTAPRTWTLPAASSLNPGQSLVVADLASGVTGTNTLTISRSGSDTINTGSSVTLSSSGAAYELWSDGVSAWTAQSLGSAAVAGVSSFNGRSGSVTPLTTDYTPTFIGAVAVVSQQSFCPSGCTTTVAAGGSATYTPRTGLLFAIIDCQGPSGGSGGAAGSVGFVVGGGGGGGGGWSRKTASASAIGAGQIVTLGAVGAAGTAGGGSAGGAGDTSVGTLCIGKGGSGGAGGNSGAIGAGGAGGVAGTGDISVPGGAGASAFYSTAIGPVGLGGAGGEAHYGSGGKGLPTVSGASTAGVTGSGFGGGPAGSSANNVASNVAGVAGQTGRVNVTEFSTQ